MSTAKITDFVHEYLSKDRIDDIFTLLKINPDTDPKTAEARILHYIETDSMAEKLVKTYLRDFLGQAPKLSIDLGADNDGDEKWRANRRKLTKTKIEGVPDDCPFNALLSNEPVQPPFNTLPLQGSGRNVEMVSRAFRSREALADTTKQRVIVTVTSADAFRAASSLSILTLHVLVGNGRASSQGVPLQTTPALAGTRFEINVADSPLSAVSFLRMMQSSPVSIVCAQRSMDGRSSVHGLGTVDWVQFFEDAGSRDSLGTRNLTLPLYPLGYPSEKGVEGASGVLGLRVEIAPLVLSDVFDSDSVEAAGASPSSALERLASTIVEIARTRREALETYRTTASAFYSNIVNAHPRGQVFESRNIPLHVLRDDGQIVPACTLVQPLYSRYLRTPRECARFVQLLPIVSTRYDTIKSQIPINSVIWSRAHTTFARSACCPEDKATLLCSLFRGFQIPAFVCIGTRRGADGDNPSEAKLSAFVAVINGGIVQLWDTSSEAIDIMHEMQYSKEGVYKMVTEDLGEFAFVTIDCLFNELEFYANLQTNNSLVYNRQKGEVLGTSLDISIASFWKRFHGPVIDGVYTALAEIPCPIIGFDAATAIACSEFLSNKLWDLIASRRSDLALQTPRCETLSRMLGPCLASYESERLAGGVDGAIGNESFKLAVRNYVKPGERFAVYPLQVNGSLRFHAPSILRMLVSSDHGRNIIDAHGDGLRLGLRVEVVGYAESVAAVWIVIGCCCTPVV